MFRDQTEAMLDLRRQGPELGPVLTLEVSSVYCTCGSATMNDLSPKNFTLKRRTDYESYWQTASMVSFYNATLLRNYIR